VTGEFLISGTQLIPLLKAAGYKGAIIIKSANHSTADREKYLACGADGTMDKLLSASVFAEELNAILEKKRAFLISQAINLDKEVLSP